MSHRHDNRREKYSDGVSGYDARKVAAYTRNERSGRRDDSRDNSNRYERDRRDNRDRRDRSKETSSRDGYRRRRSPVDRKDDRMFRSKNEGRYDRRHENKEDRKRDRSSERRDRHQDASDRFLSSKSKDSSDRRRERSTSRYGSSPDSKLSKGSSRHDNGSGRDSSRSSHSQASSRLIKQEASPHNVPSDASLFNQLKNFKNTRETSLEIQDIETSPIEMREETDVATFTFEDLCGPARPTKEVDVDPEGTPMSEEGSTPRSEERSPMNSPKTPITPLFDPFLALDSTMSGDEGDATVEAEDSAKYEKTPESAEWEDFSETVKDMHEKAMQRRKQIRHNEAVANLPVYYPGLHGCQPFCDYRILNVIAEGTYGKVYRATDMRTDEIVALKRFKMENETEGFPITALREINMLLKAGNHPNIVNVRQMILGTSVSDVYMAMEYVEHDMKSLLDKMRANNQRFRTGQQKCLVRQLLSGMEHIHKLWILHRDLKTSNLLISHSGILKIADFGLAREFGEASNIEKRMKLTPLVVTLWYRSIELLLEPKTYSTPVDMWSIGCIMAEFVMMSPLFTGSNEPNQVSMIFEMLGTPNETTWPDIKEYKVWNQVKFQNWKPGMLKKVFRGQKLLNDTGFELLSGMLIMDPKKRLTATEALNHPWFNEHPVAVSCDELPTFPAKSELNKAPPKVNRKNRLEALLAEEDPERAALLRQFNVKADQVKQSDFQLKF